MVVTGDADLVTMLRRGGTNVVAHVDSASLARTLAGSSQFDAVFVDETMAGELARVWTGFESDGLPASPPIYVLGRALDQSPHPVSLAPPRSSGPRRRAGAGPEAPDSSDPAGERTGDQPGPTGRRAASTVREWWRGTSSSATGEAAGTHRPGEASAPEVLMRQAIAVISPKGGVGKTFVAVNLAASLARHTGFRVLLLDLDLLSGDAAVHLDLVGRPTLAELLPYTGRLETTHLTRAVVTHTGAHLDVLLAPAKPEAAEMLSREHLGALVRLLKRDYDYVVMDTPPNPFDPLVTGCLAEATAVILVCSLDAAALRNCRVFLDGWATSSKEEARKRLILVLNQAHDDGPLPASQALGFLARGGGASVFTIPEDRAAVEGAVFEGRPLVLSGPGHAVSRAIFELAHAFCPVFGGLVKAGPVRRSGLGRLLDLLVKW